MPRFDLPSGGWFEIADPETIRQGHMDDILKDAAKPDDDKPFRFGLDVATGLKLLMITAWEVPYLRQPTKLPGINPHTQLVDALRELTIADNRAIEEALKPAQELLFPKKPSPDDDQLDDKASPTTPASA
jgi:hypothetical protein